LARLNVAGRKYVLWAGHRAGNVAGGGKV